MKKLITLLLLVTIAVNTYSQETILDMFKKKNKANTEKMNELSKAGFYLKKSANYQAVALGFGAASAGFFIASAFIKDKYEYNKGKVERVNDSTKDGLMIGGGVCALVGIICEINAIQYKFKSGKCLQLIGEKNGAGVALTF